MPSVDVGTSSFSTDPRAAITQLMALISPDAEMAQEMAAAFEEADGEDSDAGAETEGA